MIGQFSPMRKIVRGLKKLRTNSFTLVELLVVIRIIGLLAGLAVPAIQGGLDKAKQGVDVSNARQLGIIFFSEANDNNGMYRVNSDLTNTQAAGSFLTIVQGMFSNGVLTSAKILSGQGVIPANSTNAVTAANIAFGYVPNLSTSDDGQIPLIVSKSAPSGGTMSLAQSNVALSDTFPWKKKGLVVYRVGNSAEFLKSGTGGAPAGSVNIGITNSNSAMGP